MSIENKLSEVLRRFPKIRVLAKRIYQLIMTLINKLLNIEKCTTCNKMYTINTKDENYFGYYDKSPWNKSGNKILTMNVPFSNKHPKGNEKALVGYYSVENKEFIVIDETFTWNLQQGCMLQWVGQESENLVIYNSIKDNKYVSIIKNINDLSEKIINLPIYCLSKDGKYGLSVCFSRLGRLRPGYGYSNLEDNSYRQLAPDNNGIWFIDIENNTSKLILSLKDIIKIDSDSTMDGVEHKFNHLEFNPSGNRFMFLHRWRKKGIGYSRLFTCDIDGKNLYCLANDIMVSHSCWKDDKHILSWSRKKGIGDRYYLYKDQTKEYEIIGEGILTSDGHPSYSPDGRYIVTDTYPDKFRIKTLIVFDTKENKRYDIAKLYAPFKYDNDERCDFHPRWSRDGKYISFDSTHEGKRKQYVIESNINRNYR